jgi:hypothetical protein
VAGVIQHFRIRLETTIMCPLLLLLMLTVPFCSLMLNILHGNYLYTRSPIIGAMASKSLSL